MNKLLPELIIKCFLLIFPISVFAAEGYHTNKDPDTKVTFIKNMGQWQKEILYKGNFMTTHVTFLKDGLSFGQPGEEVHNPDGTEDYPYIVWNMKFVDPLSKLTVSGNNGKESVVSYLSGNDPSKWVIHPMEYPELMYNNVFKNIDLHFYGTGNQLKYDYIVRKDGNIKTIKAYYEGIKSMQINNNGELAVTTSYSTQIQKKPLAWQTINGMQQNVEVEYVLINDSTFGFKAPNGYDKSIDLVIDPLFTMVWSSYTEALGASNNINYCFSNAMDKDGNVYLTGMVDGTFPITPGAYSGPGSVYPDIFVAKFSKDGSTMLYSTYLPANSSEFGVSIAVDDSGRAYVTGVIDLNITGLTTFPSTANAYQPVHDAGSDAFLTVLNPTGTGLVYSTFIGGTGGETGYDIALAGNGIAYVTGSTSLGNFPVKATNTFPTGDKDVFVCKFDINQSGNNSLIYSTRIGAGSFNYCSSRGITVNSAGNVFITGTVGSGFGTPSYPITPGAFNNVFNTGQDGVAMFVTKLSATLPVSIDYSTYLGPGIANALTIAPNDEVIVTGDTRTFTFPVTAGVLQPVHGQDALGNPNSDVVLTRLNATGTGLVYSTFIGGEDSEGGTSIALNSAGETYVTGITSGNFPVSAGAYQTTLAGGFADFFIAHVNADATAYSCGGATYVGGSDVDYTGSFYDFNSPILTLLDHGGNNDTICISATSHSQDFPTTPGVYGPLKLNSIADQPVFFKLTCATTALAPTAAFNSTQAGNCSNVNVSFTDSTNNNPTSWTWYFPGGNPATSTQQNPSAVNYAASGAYTVSLVACNSAGCDSVSDTIQVTIPQAITINLGNDTTLCTGSSLPLAVAAGQASYTWLLNGTTIAGNVSTINATQQGTYSVLVTDSAGCTGADTLTLNFNNPTVTLGQDVVICNNDSTQLTATAGFISYQWWLNGISLTSGNNSIYALQQGNYAIVATDSIGCIAYDTVVVNITTPSVTLGADIILCNNDSALITATPGFASYNWQLNGNTLPSAGNTLFASQQGNYLVTITDTAGCTAADTLSVTITLVNVALINDTSFCEGNSILINAGGTFNNYQWQLNGNTISSSNSITVNTSGNYILTVTGQNNCSATDAVLVTVNPLPAVQTINDASVCNGTAVTLTTTGADNYSWSPVTYLSSSTDASPVSNPIGNISYTVTGTDANGCSNTDVVNITVTDRPNALFEYSLQNNCNGIELKTINNSTNATGYAWDFGDGTFSTETNPEHYYTTLQSQTIQLIASNSSCSDTLRIENVTFTIPALKNPPNVFTPNGDNKNDCFQLEGITSFADCFTLSVFNRWGNKVYESENVFNCWDGKNSQGKELAGGLYLYTLTVNGEKFHGTVELIR